MLFCLIVTGMTIFNGYCQSGKEFLDRGREKIKSNNFGDAITDFTRTIELDPQNADAWFLRGTLKNVLGDYSEALNDLNKSLDIKSSHNEPNLDKGENVNKKDSGLNEADQVMPNNSCLYCHLGYAKTKLDDPVAAIYFYDKAIEADPKRGETYYRKGLVHLLTDKKEEAHRSFEKAKELGYKQAEEALKNYWP